MKKKFFLYSEVCKYHSKINDNRYDYSGYLMYSEEIGMFFYRKRNRIDEVIAGYGKEYSFGIETFILNDLVERNVEYIIIETQYNVWETYLWEFLENSITAGIKGLHVCNEEHFSRIPKNLSILSYNKNKEKQKTGIQGKLF